MNKTGGPYIVDCNIYYILHIYVAGNCLISSSRNCALLCRPRRASECVCVCRLANIQCRRHTRGIMGQFICVYNLSMCSGSPAYAQYSRARNAASTQGRETLSALKCKQSYYAPFLDSCRISCVPSMRIHSFGDS